MVARLAAAVELGDGVGQTLPVEQAGRIRRELAPVHEEPALFAFEQNTVVPVVHHELDAVRKAARDAEGNRVVEVVGAGGKSVHERLREGRLPFDLGRPGMLHPDRPLRDIDVVGAPVGQLAAGVIVPPAEESVGPLFDVGGFGGGAEPAVPIEPNGWRGRLERPLILAAFEPDQHAADGAEPAAADERDRLEEPARELRPLLRSDLEDAVRGRQRVADQPTLGDRARHRLFAVDVLPRPDRLDSHFRVPVVGRADQYGVDIGSGEQVAVVLNRLRPAAGEVLSGVFEGLAVDVAHGDEVSELRRLGRDVVAAAGPLPFGFPADADRGDLRPVVFQCARPRCGLRERTEGHERAGRGREAQERSAGRCGAVHGLLPHHPARDASFRKRPTLRFGKAQGDRDPGQEQQ